MPAAYGGCDVPPPGEYRGAAGSPAGDKVFQRYELVATDSAPAEVLASLCASRLRYSVQTFLFYPYMANGSASVFEARDFPDAAAAVVHASVLLVEHQTADYVEVWEGDILIHTVRRGNGGEP